MPTILGAHDGACHRTIAILTAGTRPAGAFSAPAVFARRAVPAPWAPSRPRRPRPSFVPEVVCRLSFPLLIYAREILLIAGEGSAEI